MKRTSIFPSKVQESIDWGFQNILWCSPHNPTDDQIKEFEDEGCRIYYLKDKMPEWAALLFNLKKEDDLNTFARSIWKYAYANDYIIAQLGGSPAFLHAFGRVQELMMVEEGLNALPIMWAYSERVSEDVPQPDGSVKKMSVFKHKGWV